MYATCFALLPWLLFSHPRQQLPCLVIPHLRHSDGLPDKTCLVAAMQWKVAVRTTVHIKNNSSVSCYVYVAWIAQKTFSFIFVNNQLILCFLCYTQVWICKGRNVLIYCMTSICVNGSENFFVQLQQLLSSLLYSKLLTPHLLPGHRRTFLSCRIPSLQGSRIFYGMEWCALPFEGAVRIFIVRYGHAHPYAYTCVSNSSSMVTSC